VTRVVVDASAALAWILPTQRSHAADQFILDPPGPLIAPAIVRWEVGNVLLSFHQAGRLTVSDYLEGAGFAEAFEIAVASAHDPALIEPLARLERLSLFDACYLAQAEIEEADLVSRDRNLIATARNRGVMVWDLQ
jgi:predicted nucleic acid-binding protein